MNGVRALEHAAEGIVPAGSSNESPGHWHDDDDDDDYGEMHTCRAAGKHEGYVSVPLAADWISPHGYRTPVHARD